MKRNRRERARTQAKELNKCDNKPRYKTLANAQAHVTKYLRVYGKRQYPYPCPGAVGIT